MVARTLDLHRFSGDVRGNLGKLDLEEGNLQQAEEWFSGALKAHSFAQAWDQMFWDLFYLAKIAFTLGKRVKATEYVHRGIELADAQTSSHLGTFSEYTWSERKKSLLEALGDFERDNQSH